MDRVFEFIDEKYDIKDSPNAQNLEKVEGEIEFDHVSFRYDEEEELVLQDISLKAKKKGKPLH